MPAARDPIYLDHNATTPILPEVLEAMLPYLREHFGNPSSGHIYGRRVHQAVEAARARVAALIGAAPEEIVFTSGGTESNNLAIRGVAAARPDRVHIVTSAIEHPATDEPCRALSRARWVVSRARVDTGGRILLDATRLPQEKTSLVTLIHASNETGVLQPVAEFAAAGRAVGAIVHTDAAQSVGKLPVDVDVLGVDLLSIAGHKLYAPKGVGALYVRVGTPIVPVALGAEQEHALRPGTENVASIVGLGVACEIAARTLEEERKRVSALRDELWRQLETGIGGIRLNGGEHERLPNTLNVRLPGVRGQAALDACPEVAASTGSACHAGSEAPSKVLTAMGLGEQEALGALRLSLGRGTTAEAVDRAASALIAAWRRVTQQGPGRLAAPRRAEP